MKRYRADTYQLELKRACKRLRAFRAGVYDVRMGGSEAHLR